MRLISESLVSDKPGTVQVDIIARAKAEGKYTGRQPTPVKKKNRIKELAATTDMTRQQIADEVCCGIATVYRVLKNI